MIDPPLHRAPPAGCNLVYLQRGDGAPLVFIHGALCDARYWAPQLEFFSQSHRAIAVSLRHCWPDVWDGGDDYTAGRHVDDLIAFLGWLDAGPVHLVGHSRGGRLAIHVAARAPGLVKSLALYQPGGAYDATFLPPAPAPTLAVDTPLARIMAGEIEGGLKMFLDGVAGDGGWESARDDLRTILRANARTLIAMSRDASEPMTRAAAEAIKAPTLLIGGDAIPTGFIRVLDALEGYVKDAHRARIASASHFANLENPQIFNIVLAAFLGRLPQA